jgi:hypothetical protein
MYTDDLAGFILFSDILLAAVIAAAASCASPPVLPHEARHASISMVTSRIAVIFFITKAPSN